MSPTNPGPPPGIFVNANGSINYTKSTASALQAGGYGGGVTKDDPTGAATIYDLPKKIDPKEELWYASQSNGFLSGAFDKTLPFMSQPFQSHDGQDKAVRSTVLKIYRQYDGMSGNDPASFVALQQQLAAVSGGVKVNGTFDHATQAALKSALYTYYTHIKEGGTPVSFSDFMAQAQEKADLLHPGASSGAGGRAAPKPPPALQLNLQDPEQIKAAAQAAAQQALGQGLSDDQLNAFVTQFQQQQTSSQTSSYNDQLSNTAGSTTQQDLSSDAMQFAQGAEPGEYQQNQRQSFLNALVNMAAPSGSGRPNMTPTASVGGTGG